MSCFADSRGKDEFHYIFVGNEAGSKSLDSQRTKLPLLSRRKAPATAL